MPNSKKNYQAVTIDAQAESCLAAKTYSGKKLLIDEFDEIVLKHCHLSECVCEFKTHADRRSGLDRRYLTSDGSHSIVMNNRRLSYGRRKDDIHNKSRDSNGEVDLANALFEYFQKKMNN